MQETTLTKLKVPGWALHLFIKSYFGESTIAFPLEIQREFQHRLDYYGLDNLHKYEKPDDPRFLCTISINAKPTAALVLIGETAKKEYHEHGLFPYYQHTHGRGSKEYFYYFHEFDSLNQKEIYLKGVKNGDPFGACIILSDPERIVDEWWQELPVSTRMALTLPDADAVWSGLPLREKWAIRNYIIVREKNLAFDPQIITWMYQDVVKIATAIQFSYYNDIPRSKLHDRDVSNVALENSDKFYQDMTVVKERISKFDYIEARRAAADPQRCENCGSLGVEEKVWRDPNTQMSDDTESDDYNCFNCVPDEITPTTLIAESELMQKIEDWWTEAEIGVKEKISETTVSFYIRPDVPEDEYMALFHEDANKVWNALTADEKIAHWNKYKTSENGESE